MSRDLKELAERERGCNTPAVVGDEWYKQAFGGVHMAGRTIASAFGGSALADQAEQYEAPILPDWATKDQGAGKKAAQATVDQAKQATAAAQQQKLMSGSGATLNAISSPDHLVMKTSKGNTVIDNVGAVVVTGGRRFDGNGYQSGDTKKFSFGYDAPQKVDVVLKSGQKISYGDVKLLAVCGGTEQTGAAGA